MIDYYHTWTIEHEGDEWYKIIYKVSDGFQTNIVVNQADLASLYKLIGDVFRADHNVQNVWSTTVKGS